MAFLGNFGGDWGAGRATGMSNLFPGVSRLCLYQEHAGLDLKKMVPASDDRDQALIATWDWNLYLSSAEKLFKAGYPIGLPMGQTADTYDWVSVLFRSYGSVLVDGKGQLEVGCGETPR